MKSFTGFPPNDASPIRSCDEVRFVFFGDGRKPDMLPVFLLQDVADQIVLVQALHNNNDASGLLVIEPAV